MTERTENIGLMIRQNQPHKSVVQEGTGECVGMNDVIAYVVASISEFAKTHHITAREANNYLIRFKGIDFLTEHYDAEHLLSFEDCVQDLTQICLNNGGGIR